MENLNTKLINLEVHEFLDAVDSKTATPGGGSVAALSVAEGISLIRMVGHLSVTKKKFLGLTDDLKLDYQNRMEELENLKSKALDLIDLDTNAFNKIMAAFGLPKETEEELSIRNSAINEATIIATDVPLDTASVATKALEVAEPMFKTAAVSATSDFGVGVAMIKAGFIGANMNVLTNLKGFSDLTLKNEYLEKLNSMKSKVEEISEKLIKLVNNKLEN